jgi:hypothetical protein
LAIQVKEKVLLFLMRHIVCLNFWSPKRICEHTKRILNQKFLCKENERTTMNFVAHHDLSYIG